MSHLPEAGPIQWPTTDHFQQLYWGDTYQCNSKGMELPKAPGLTEEAPGTGRDPYRGCSAHSTHPTFFWGGCPWNYGSALQVQGLSEMSASDVVPEDESGTPGCRCSAGGAECVRWLCCVRWKALMGFDLSHREPKYRANCFEYVCEVER